MTLETKIATERLLLSVIKQADSHDVFKTMNYPATADAVSFLTWPITMDQARSWCTQAEKGLQNETDFLYISRMKTNQNPVGCIGLHGVKNEEAEIGYWVSEDHQGHGYASEMLKSIVDCAFSNFKVKSLFATAIPDNLKSRSVLTKNGFRQAGETTVPVAEGKIAERHLYRLNK